jgi:predicted alpha/beta-hydrolase family hydrolase
MSLKQLTIEVPDVGPVTGLSMTPVRPIACYVLAHGAGAGMRHKFIEAVASGLAERDIATLRFQFPYMERGLKRPDRPAVAMATVRAAVSAAHPSHADLPLVAGGKSFGARMTSEAQAAEPLPGVRGLAFIGFPLHPAGKPTTSRADHLKRVKVPMLFLQGTRDALADVPLLEEAVMQLGPSAKVIWLLDADHSFHVPARCGRTNVEVLNDVLNALRAWIKDIVTNTGNASGG